MAGNLKGRTPPGNGEWGIRIEYDRHGFEGYLGNVGLCGLMLGSGIVVIVKNRFAFGSGAKMTQEEAEKFWELLVRMGERGNAAMESGDLKVFSIIKDGEVQTWVKEGNSSFKKLRPYSGNL